MIILRKSYCTSPGISVDVGIGIGVGGGIGISKMLKFYVKVFYVMGKALSGKLSCPCDKFCCNKKYWHISVFDV